MKKIFIPALALTMLVSGCENFLNSENIYGKDLENFYATPDEVSEAVGGMYVSMYAATIGGDESMIANIMDDIVLGGGGAGGEEDATYIDAFKNKGTDFFKEMWTDTYEGVYRANAIIERLSDPKYNLDAHFNSPSQAKEFVDQALAEAYFMRGYCMFRAARFFGGLPLIPKTDSPRNVPRASYTETFRMAMSDFKVAVDLFPNISANRISPTEYGHANRWVAIGYLSRAYMFYTGYMTNIENKPTTEITLNSNAGDVVVNKEMVIKLLEDCRDNSGFYLVPKFANLWAYSYLNAAGEIYGDANGDNVLPWAKEEKLEWVGQDGFTSTLEGTSGNPEVMFSVRYGLAMYNTPSHVGTSNTNRMCMVSGPRDNTLVPFYKGWGYCPVNSSFFADWDDADERKEASAFEMGDAQHRADNFTLPTSHQYTGIQQKKYTGLVIKGKKFGVHGLFSYVYDTKADNVVQQGHATDFILMRFSDILLMHSELTESADGLNTVRQRVGLSETTYSLEALKKERMYEFAFEGRRWFDLVRWGDINSSSEDVYFNKTFTVKNNKLDEQYSMTYPKAQKGLLPVPETEITLSNGVYTQNPGW